MPAKMKKVPVSFGTAKPYMEGEGSKRTNTPIKIRHRPANMDANILNIKFVIWDLHIDCCEVTDVLRNYQLSQFYRYQMNIARFFRLQKVLISWEAVE